MPIASDKVNATPTVNDHADHHNDLADAANAATDHIADEANPHGVTKAQVGLGNVTNDAQIPLAQKGEASGVATLGVDGIVPEGQLPPVGSSSGLPSNVLTKTANFTAADEDHIEADATGGGFTITLPATGAVIVIKTDASANAVLVDAGGGGTVNGDAGGASIAEQHFGGIFVSTAANVWRMVAVSAASGGITDAASLTFTPTGTIAATNTQAAVAEVATDAAGALSTHTANTSNPHSVTKTQVGLGSADNTADTAKTIAGDVTGTLGAAVVAKVKGKTVPTPGAPEDQMTWKYDHATGAMVWTALPGGGAGPTLLAVTSDQVLTSQATLQDMAGMSLAISASATEVWLVYYWLLFNTANLTMDVKIGFSVPAGCTIAWGEQTSVAGWLPNGTAGTASSLLTAATTRSFGGMGGGPFGYNLTAIVFGGGTAGNVKFQFAQNTSDAGALTALRGSSRGRGAAGML